MLSNTKAIVLQTIKYGESGVITKVYTEKYGKLSFLIHGVRRKKSKISNYLFQPFSLLDIIAYIKESRDLQRIKEVKPTVVLKTLFFDVRKSSIALFLGEIMNRTLHESEPNFQLFNYLNHAVQILDYFDKGIENFHLIFLMQFTKFLGIYPKNNTDLIQYSDSESIHMADLIDLSLTDIKTLKIDSSLRFKLLEQLMRYYKDHMEGIDNIKSIGVLRDVFAN